MYVFLTVPNCFGTLNLFFQLLVKEQPFTNYALHGSWLVACLQLLWDHNFKCLSVCVLTNIHAICNINQIRIWCTWQKMHLRAWLRIDNTSSRGLAIKKFSSHQKSSNVNQKEVFRAGNSFHLSPQQLQKCLGIQHEGSSFMENKIKSVKQDFGLGTQWSTSHFLVAWFHLCFLRRSVFQAYVGICNGFQRSEDGNWPCASKKTVL